MIQFELPEEKSSIIKVMGIGGGGSNAVNHMFRQGIKGVDFYICNTDAQALNESPVPNKIQLGKLKTKGLGAGSIPDVGREAALESQEEIRKVLSENTEMVFLTAGLGGGTGTGAAPVIAAIAKELGILTVGIVTLPFVFEGKKRKMYAEEGLEELKKHVDTLIVICNEKLREIYGSLKIKEAFSHADNVLTNAAKSIAELISTHLHINLDLNDVRTVMKDSGLALMGTASASGENRALRAVQEALASPLLNDNDIVGARHVLLSIMAGSDDINMDEFEQITDFVNQASGNSAEVIFGYGTDPSLGDSVSVTIIATGFPSGPQQQKPDNDELVVHNLSHADTSQTENSSTTASSENQQDSSNGLQMELKINEPSPADVLSSGTSEPNLPNEEKIKIFSLDDEPSAITNPPDEIAKSGSVPSETIIDPTKDSIRTQKESLEVVKERIRQLKNITKNYKNPELLSKLEKEPAYIRQNILDEELNYLSESDDKHSNFTIDEEDGKPKIKPNNSFLHGQPS